MSERTIRTRLEPRSTTLRHRRRRLLQEQLEARVVLSATIGNNIDVGDSLQNYRLAIAATEEYTAYFGGEAQALAAIEDFVDDVNEIFEKELSIHFDLVSGTNTIFDASIGEFDSYTNGNTSAMLNENTAILNGIVGESNYDIGHVFGLAISGGQGLAGLGVVNTIYKGRGASIHAMPQGTSWVHLVAHEFGHQFNAEHTFNGNTYGSTAGSRSATSAYEPASGSTLMSYAGIAGQDNLQSDPDPYFHSASFEEIQSFIASTAPPNSTTPLSNNVPTVSGGADYTIPQGTPFALTATGNDADAGDTLTYTWEQLDLGSAMSLPLTDNGDSPLFRSFPPSTEPTRVFPKLSDLAAGVDTAAIGETLPTTARELNFRASVRDGNGGIHSDDVKLTVVNTATPFSVTSPNTGVNWAGGSNQTISWNTAGTQSAPFNVSSVDIDLSIDGGLTYPISLISGTANDGSEMLTIPNLDTSNARVRVSAVGNVFFDLSDTDFTIAADAGAPGISIVESAGSTQIGEPGLLGSSPIDTYLLSLTTTPTSAVEVTVSADAQTEVSLDGNSFSNSVIVSKSDTSASTIYVRGLDDTDAEGVHSGVITHTVSTSGDANYPIGLNGPPITASIGDDEVQPVIGTDFDRPGEPSPENWTLTTGASTYSNLIREDGVVTTVDLSITRSGGSGANLSDSPTAPLHTPDLADIGGNYIAANSITLTWSGLDAGVDYNVYLFLTENFGIDVHQSVAITGETSLPVFEQDTRGLGSVLYVNDSLANPSKPLEDDAVTVTADASGQIQAVVTNLLASDYAILAGTGIQLAAASTPSINASLAATTDGDEEGPVDVVFTVSLNQANDSGAPITFDLTDVGTGSATSGLDYTEIANGTQVTIGVGQTTGTVSIAVSDDALVEGTETLVAQIASPSDPNVTIVADSATAQIFDNEGGGTLTVDIDADAISESAGAGVTTVTITRNTDTTAPLDLVIANNDPSEISIQSNVTIPAGSASVTIPLDAVNDSYLDGVQLASITVSEVGYDGSINLDPTFGSAGIVSTNLRNNISPTGFDLLIDPNGRIVTGGRDETLDDTIQVARFNEDGSPDLSFGTNGFAAVTVGSETSVRISRILRGDDGRLTIIGRTSSGGFIARLTSTGALDTSFDSDGILPVSLRYFRDGLIHPDGSVTAISAESVLRYSDDGSLDNTFGINGELTPILDPAFDETYSSIVEQADGKFVIAGTTDVSSDRRDVFAARFNADGTIDTSFGSNGYRAVNVNTQYPTLEKVEITSDGGILLVGGARSPLDWLMAKLDSTGDLDTNFGLDGLSFVDFEGSRDEAYDVVLQEDGKILVFGGGFVIGNGDDRAMARFNADGSLDTTFSDDGYTTFPPFTPTEFEGMRAAAFTADGKVVTLSGWVADFQIERWILPQGLAGSDTVAVTDDDVIGVGYLAGIDVDFNLNPPTNWGSTEYLYGIDRGNLLGEDGNRTPFDVQSDIAGTSFTYSSSPNANTIPQHTQSLANLAGFSTNSTGNSFTSTISDLTPGEQYRIYLFAHETTGSTFSQEVTLVGDNTISFTQSLTHGNLHVNASQGSNNEQLDSYAELVTADANGEIAVSIAPASGSAGVVLSGFAIQHIVTSNDRVTVSIDSTSISENGGSATGTVTRNTGTTGELVVTLTSSDTTEATVPTTVTIPDGSDTVNFTITAVDDAIIDGDQSVTITATATNHLSGDASLDVIDDEELATGPLIGIDFGSTSSSPASPTNWNAYTFLGQANATNLLAEDGTTTEVDIQTTVTNGSAAGAGPFASELPQHAQSLAGIAGYATGSSALQSRFSDLIAGAEYAVYLFAYEPLTNTYINDVTITGSNTDSFTQIPDSVLYVNGQTGSSNNLLQSYASYITADANGEIVVDIAPGAGSSGVILSAMALQQLGPGPDRLTVELDMTSISENGGTATGTVTRNTGTSGNLTVDLFSSDTTEATVPASVVIPDGSDSVTFSVSAIDDAIVDGTQSVIISASATDFVAGTADLEVLDDEAPAFGPFVGVDFDTTTANAPLNWTSLTSPTNQVNLIAEDGSSTPFDLSFSGSLSGYSATINSSTVPTHTSSLLGLDNQFYSSSLVSFTWSDLTPGSNYEVYVIGLDGGFTISQNVSVTDANGTDTFQQSFSPNNLFINNAIGSSSNSFESYGLEYVADSFGQIQISVSVASGSFLGLGGLAIREVQSTPAINASLSVTTHGDEEGPTDIVYTVTLDQPNNTGSPITFDFDDLGTGTASSGVDYETVLSNAQISVADGATTGTFVVDVIDDGEIEPTETLEAQISNASVGSVNITTSTATADLVDNDVIPTLTLVVNADSVSEADGNAATTVTITRSVASPAPLTVNLASDDTSEATVPATATIPAGQTSVTVDLDAVDDAIVDGTQTVTITASAQFGSGTTGLDAAFGTGGVAETPLYNTSSALQGPIHYLPNGKIVVASQGPTTSTIYLAQLNADGSLDGSFGNAGLAQATAGPDFPVPQAIAVQPDGKILVGGKFVSGTGKPFVVRFNPDGSVDTSYGTNGVANLAGISGMWVQDMELTPDGKILATTSVNGSVYFRMLRITADGDRDSTFGSNGVRTYSTLNYSSQVLKVLADGSFIAAGRSVGEYAVIRAFANGDLDTSFNGTGIQTIDLGTQFMTIGEIAIDSDGRYVFGAQGYGNSEESNSYAIRLNPNGSFDTTFDGDGIASVNLLPSDDDRVSSVQVQQDNKVVLVGYLDPASNQREMAITRLNENGSLDTSFDGDGTLNYSSSNYASQRSLQSALSPNGALFVLGGSGDDQRVAKINLLGSTTISASDTVSVTDDDVLPATVTIEATNDSVAEDGTANLIYTITRDGDTSQPLTVHFGTSGSASLGSDFNSQPDNSITIAAGATTAEVIVNPTPDTVVEGDETVVLSLQTGTGYVIGSPNNATGTIVDNDVASLTIDDVTIVEGGTAEVPVTLDNAVQGGFLADLSFVDGTAIGNVDFNNATYQVTFAGTAGETVIISVPTFADGIPEPSETFTVRVDALHPSVTDTDTGTVTIEEAAVPVVSISVDPTSVFEDASGAFVFTLTRTDTDAQTPAMEVNLQLTGTATLDDDFAATAVDHVTFAAGEATTTVTITPSADLQIEPDETIILSVVSGDGYVVAGGNTATATILNDDVGGPPLQVADIVYFNANADDEQGYTPDASGQRSIIRRVRITLSAPITIPTGPVTDGSFSLQATSGRDAGEAVNLEVVSSEVVNGQQVVVLQFAGRSAIEPSSRRVNGPGLMLADGNYRLTISGSVLGIDANGSAPGDDFVDDFFRLFGDYDADGDVDSADSDQFDHYYDDGTHSAVFDFDAKPNRRGSDRTEFFKRFGSRLE
ncbi:Calx-beta domain-containing protein [Roseiconus lacunae]|uniref:Calx-beta domain-containing protein n=1 Tax=Roseiconus lacunae TaxID=2605694 RepID=UPI001E31758B|nr:Calx-beta domain-containing protein [Roseiconus lacunae]MCD0461718.1 M12 family metallo-peptidase [Roseiconus lacunae]